MPHIEQLSPHIANLIAAGEVVERPASVVKELLENAIDAGARNVAVELQNGGLTYLRVTDDGCGIAPDELPTAFLRHATSKLRTAADLAAIGTLGFRGEALAAIASVSRMDIFSRQTGAASGATLHLDGGKPLSVEPAGCPEGTSIIVRDLFYNTPARLKFMKQDRAEATAIAGLAAHIALSHPDISFRLIKDGREELHTPGDGKPLSAVYAALGRDFALALVEVHGRDGQLAVDGFVTKPLAGRGTRGMQTFFVNGRFIKSQLLTAAVEEAYTNYATTKAYNLEEHCAERHAEINDARRVSEAKATYLSAIVQPVIAASNSLAYIAINLLGGWLIVRQGVPVGVIVTLVLFARQFSEPLEQISNGLSTLQQAKAAARRVVDLLELPEEAPIEQELPAGGDGSVEFRHVDFSYEPDTELIQDLNLHVEKGQHVAIVGPTGAGKTTIVNLLMRFYDVDSGSILLSGCDIADYSRASTRDRFGMVLQDTWLFGGTIAENVAFGKPDATREEIIRACDEVYCDHFIRTLPQGYDTSSISSGQKQLLTIARALLAQRELLILDEATSNVDTRTELLIQKAMDRLMRGRTCFIIAHRLSTIVDADLILVLRDGRIVEQGKHRDLLEKKGFYYEIYKSQYDIA